MNQDFFNLVGVDKKPPYRWWCIGPKRSGTTIQEAISTPFCLFQEKFPTVVLRGVRNISEAP